MAKNKKLCATNRFWLKFYLLTLITFGIYAIVFWVRWGKDLNKVKELKQLKGKKLMHGFGAMILGIFTLGIIPMVWMLKLVIRTYVAADTLKTKKYGSIALVLIFATLLSWTVICPIIGFHKLCKTMNGVGKAYNTITTEPVAPVETPVPAVKTAEEPKQVEKKGNIENLKKGGEKAKEVATQAAEKSKKLTVKKDKPAPAKVPESKKPVEDKKPAPAKKAAAPKKTATTETKNSGVGADGAKIYHISKRKDDSKWQVKFANGQKAIKLFDTQAEAIEFAKELAKNQDGSIRIHSVKGKIRK